jgi:selenocysteine lyase/cysteine desulfurase
LKSRGISRTGPSVQAECIGLGKAEPGALSLLYGLEQSLKLLNNTGLDRIEKYLNEISDELCEQLAAKDYDIVSSRRPGERSAIVCIKTPWRFGQ